MSDVQEARKFLNTLPNHLAPRGIRGIDIASTFVDNPDAAWQALRTVVEAGGTGWCVTTDRVWRLKTVADVNAAQKTGTLLDAELSHDVTVSTHIRHLGARWQVTTFTESEAPTHWVQRIERRGIDPDSPEQANALVYHAYWKIDVDLTADPLPQIQPDAVRFIELKQTGKN